MNFTPYLINMAENTVSDDTVFQAAVPATPPVGFKPATDELPDGGHAQLIGLQGGPEHQARATGRVGGDATFGLDVDVTRSALPTGAATEATLAADLGALTETAPATDTASSGLNGRLQRVAQRLTSLIALLPSSIGQKAAAGSLSVVLASDQSAVPISGTVTASGPLTDTQLRATAVPVSGTVTATTGGLTDTQLRAAAVPISAASLPLPSGAATEATLTTTNTEVGGLTETAPATDTASSGLNGRLQRIAQRLTSIIALLPTALGTSGGLKVDGSGTALPVSGTVTANIGTAGTLALDATLSTTNTDLGGVTETAPATDTASSGLNGRLQRIAQRLTSLIALLPTALGQGTMAQSLRVVLPSDQTAIPASQSGTWTVQPGNTPNSTPWLVTAGHGKTIKTATGSGSATATVIAAVTSKRIKIIAYSLTMVGATAVTVTFKDGASGTALWMVGPLQTAAATNSGANLSVPAPSFLFATSAGVLLEMNLSASVSVTWSLTYFDDDAT